MTICDCMTRTAKLNRKQEEYIKSLGFKKEMAKDKSCYWFIKKLKNKFIRKCHVIVESDFSSKHGSIIVWGLEPKCISGHSNNAIMISGLPFSKKNLKKLMEYFEV